MDYVNEIEKISDDTDLEKIVWPEPKNKALMVEG